MAVTSGKAMALCSVSGMFNRLSARWTLAVLRQIEIGKVRRFHELMKELEGISARTLSKRLSEMEKMGVLVREKFNEVPPRIEYSLTSKGKKLVSSFKNLEHWAEEFKER